MLKVAATDDVGGGVLGSPVELILRHRLTEKEKPTSHLNGTEPSASGGSSSMETKQNVPCSTTN